MADPILRLDPSRLTVEPGGRASATLTVTNPGTIVESYSIDVVSTVPLPWVRVEPSPLPVYPQQEATAEVVFSPPSGPGAPGGTFPFGVRAWSDVHGGGSAVAEGDLDVGSLAGLHAKLTPIASTGRWSGRHTLTISNWGNAPARLRLTPEDPDLALGFLVVPEVVDVPLGGQAAARIKVRTRHPTLRGAAQRLPFTVVCEPDQAPPEAAAVGAATSTPSRPVLDGAFNQKPILTRMVVVVAALALVAAIAGVAYLLRRDEPGADEQAQQPDQPTGFRAASAPGVVTLSWDRVAGVAAYSLRMTAPVDGEAEVVSSPARGDASRLQSRIKVETEDRYCYRIVAVREGAPPSAPSRQRCVRTTLPAAAPAGPTESPTIIPIPPPDTGAGGGESSSPSSSAAPPSGSPSSAAAPLPFIAVLKFYLVSGGLAEPAATRAEEDRATIAELGFETKVLSTDDWRIGGTPIESSYLLYVVGVTPAEATEACQAVVAGIPEVDFQPCVPLTITGPATPTPSSS